MNYSSMLVLGICVVGLVSVAPVQDASAQGGWTTLFDGSNLDNFNPIGDANWEIADGAVGADSGSGFLVTKESYADFELTLEFWVDEPANSGIFVRCADAMSVTDRNSYEVNIYDTRADQTYRTGGIVHIAAPNSVIMTGGKWNSYEIKAEGSRLMVTLNGEEMVDVRDTQFSDGPIALQYGLGIVKFRNVRVRGL
ncbi:MAG: DUF1080 domain-containing protein [Acidobacteriota bacterium]|nr:DUF1080 domain-containing protein [Acidobacteriota bacterium]